MFLYSSNIETLQTLEKQIHERRNEIEPNYKCEKWADIQKHSTKDEYAFSIDQFCLQLIELPENVQIIEILPDDFLPEIEEL